MSRLWLGTLNSEMAGRSKHLCISLRRMQNTVFAECMQLHAITTSDIPGGPCGRWFSRRDRWRPPGCDGGSLHSVQVDTRWASFRQVRHGAGHGFGEARSAGHPACIGRGWLRRRRFPEPLAPGALALLDTTIHPSRWPRRFKGRQPWLSTRPHASRTSGIPQELPDWRVYTDPTGGGTAPYQCTRTERSIPCSGASSAASLRSPPRSMWMAGPISNRLPRR